MVIAAGKKDRHSKTPLFKYLVDSEAIQPSLTKSKAGKIPVQNTKQERQWSTASGVLNTNTKTATSVSFPELHSNKLINQSLNVVEINIDRYDIIIGRDLISSLGIDIHGADMTTFQL